MKSSISPSSFISKSGAFPGTRDWWNTLKLDKAKEARLNELTAEYFDGLQINLDDTPTVDSLLEKIVETQVC